MHQACPQWYNETAMKRNEFLSLLLLGGSALSCSRQPANSARMYRNPLPVAFGDPFVLYEPADQHFYMYGTGGGARDGFGVYVSPDLAEWQYAGQVYHGNTADSWCTGSFWAPEAYKIEDRYFLFYSAQWRDNPTNELENFRIGVAAADRPTGPFQDLRNSPLFNPGYPIIDANLFVDNDGRNYLYYSRCCYKNPVESEIASYARKQGWYDEIEES